MLVRTLELLGVRGFYLAMSRLAGERMLPRLDEPNAAGWSRQKIAEIREGSRYFLIANVFRLMVYVGPGIVAAQHSSVIPLATMGVIVLFHVLCIVLELYKSALCRIHSDKLSSGQWVECEAPDPPDIRLSPRMDWWFSPRRWESEPLYRVIGVEMFKSMVTWYIDNTRLTKEERDSGKRPSYIKGLSPLETLKFVRDTRVAESIHLCAFFINVPLFIEGLVLNLPLIVWFVLPVLILDAYLVLLQRHHRLRMWPVIVRARSLSAKEA